MLSIDSSDIIRLEHDLGVFAGKSIPYATRQTLSDLAFSARAHAQTKIKSDFINRNQYTARSVGVDKAKGTNMRTMYSVVGSRAPYMLDQEFGGTKTAKGKHGVGIPTSYAAGQEGSKPRTKVVRKANRHAKIKLSDRVRSGSRKAIVAATIRAASAKGRKFVFLELERSKGFFRLEGGRKRPKIKMVWAHNRKSVKIPKNEWLKPSYEQAASELPQIYQKNLTYQAERNNLFK